jgi:hypothetical protein
MLDYSLGLLEDGPHAMVTREAAADPELAGRLDRLSASLDLLLDDGPGPEPPPGLARQTILRVAERRRRTNYADVIPMRVPFRWADVAVAASLFLACLLTLVPAVRRSRESWYTAACTNNLQQLGLALNRYATTHQEFPLCSADDSAPYAGGFALHLNDGGFLPTPSLLDCPSNGHSPVPQPLPAVHTIRHMPPHDARNAPCLRDADYAYTLGYVQEGRRCRLPRHLPDSFPLLADKPPFSDTVRILEGNSPNHRGAGQNVLFVGGHVTWQRTRRLGSDDDMFLNDRHQPAPGLHAGDVVLVPAITRLDGR